MMVQNLMILTGAVQGIRDLVWTPDANDRATGYNVYRSPNGLGNWTLLNTTPVPGRFYRDETTLEDIDYLVLPGDWVERASEGHFIFKVPDAPLYAKVLAGRGILASGVDDVMVTIDGNPHPAARIDPFEGTIWLHNTRILREGVRKEFASLKEFTDNSVVRVRYRRLTNFVEPTPEVRAFYTVVPVKEGGALAHFPGADGTEKVNILEVDRMNYMQAAMVNWNAWMFNESGEPAHLLIRRCRGKRCGCVIEGQSARTGCTSCYETGYVGGYYGPFDIPFLDPDTALSTEVEEGGRKVTRSSRSYLGPQPFVQEGDLIVRKNGERLVISNPTYKSPNGVLLQQEFSVDKLPAGDTRYFVPLRPPVTPVIYNPGFQDSPGVAGEPLVEVTTDPTKVWENQQRMPSGRQVIFANIET